MPALLELFQFPRPTGLAGLKRCASSRAPDGERPATLGGAELGQTDAAGLGPQQNEAGPRAGGFGEEEPAWGPPPGPWTGGPWAFRSRSWGRPCRQGNAAWAVFSPAPRQGRATWADGVSSPADGHLSCTVYDSILGSPVSASIWLTQFVRIRRQGRGWRRIPDRWMAVGIRCGSRKPATGFVEGTSSHSSLELSASRF